ncbi:hypothetical protein BGX30_001810 [Mortierella sp. GBA39]|nr:hypothetical protein BGX30_001810 [Mortierella sp. GBA39]
MGAKIKDAIGFHSSSEYGPADPNDLPLSDPKTLHLMDRAPIAAAATAAGVAAVVAPLVAKSMTTPTTTPTGDASVAGPVAGPVVAPAVAPAIAPATATVPSSSEMQFTDPKTLRPVTEQRTWDIPTTADNRSMGTKVKNAMGFHDSSEYGPADPNDLPLSDPKSPHLMDRVPVAAAATAAGVAAVAAPIIHKATTTTTEIRPVVVKEEKQNPVLSAPRPVIPVTTATTEPNPVLSAPHPIIPEKEISTTQVDPTPVQTAPRPMIPASAIENHSTTGRAASPHPVIPMADKQTTATTTSHHSGLEKVAAPIVAGAAAAPILQYHHQQQQQHTIPAPVVQQQHQIPTTTATTPYSTNSSNTGSYNTPALAAPVATQLIPSTTEVSAADKTASAVPESYSGPVPQVHPGEEVVWVKTVTTTDFYDDKSPLAPPGTVVNNTKNNGSNHNNGSDHNNGSNHNNGLAPNVGVPANTMHDNKVHGKSRKRLSGFFDRLIHRHHDNVDKGKQRM